MIVMKRKRLCIFILGCFYNIVAFSQIQNGKYVFQQGTFIVGVSANLFETVNLADARAVSSVLLQEIVDNWAINLSCQMVIYENIELMMKDIRENNLEVIAVTTPEYFMLRDQVNITPFLTYKLSDRTLDRMLLVTRKDSPFRSIVQLKRKKIAVYSNLSAELNLPIVWLTTRVLMSGGNFQDEYASSIYKVRKGMNAISDVFFKNADAAVVPELPFNISKELNPQIGLQLSVIDSSNYMLYSVLCYTERLTAGLNRYKDRNVQTVTDLLCNTDKTEIGKRFLSVFRIVSFVPYKSEYLNNTETLFNEYKTLTLNKNRRVK
jgi:ABC-type phosphate/phosphonate transport system substrate-binding protein